MGAFQDRQIDSRLDPIGQLPQGSDGRLNFFCAPRLGTKRRQKKGIRKMDIRGNIAQGRPTTTGEMPARMGETRQRSMGSRREMKLEWEGSSISQGFEFWFLFSVLLCMFAYKTHTHLHSHMESGEGKENSALD